MKHCIISFMPRVQLNNAVANSIVSSSSRYSLKVLVANIDYDDFKGKLGVGRVHSGSLQKGQTVGLGRPDCPVKAGKISELFVFDNLGRTVRVAVLRGPQFCPGSVLFQALFFFCFKAWFAFLRRKMRLIAKRFRIAVVCGMCVLFLGVLSGLVRAAAALNVALLLYQRQQHPVCLMFDRH